MNSRIRNTAESVYLGLGLAKAHAVQRRGAVSFRLTDVRGAWVIETGCNPQGLVCVTPLNNSGTREDPGLTVVVVENQGAGINYTFNEFGRLITPAGNASIAVDNTAMDPAVSRDLRITVTAGGLVELCDPNVAAGDLRVCRF